MLGFDKGCDAYTCALPARFVKMFFRHTRLLPRHRLYLPVLWLSPSRRMGPTLYSWLPLSISQSKADLESEPHTTRARNQRVVFLRKRRLLFSTCTLFLFVVLVMGGLHYIRPRGIYGIHRSSSLLQEPPRYIVFKPPTSSPEPLSGRPLRASPRLPERCLESHISLGYPCFINEPIHFDIVWTWVNGSDHRFQDAMEKSVMPKTAAAPSTRENGTSNSASKLYRNHDELRHSFRSVLQHFRKYTRRFHLLTSDFPFSEDDYARLVFPGTSSPTSTTRKRVDDSLEKGRDDWDPLDSDPEATSHNLRLGQLPSWLSAAEEDRWRDGNVELKVAYHAQVFQNYTGTSFNSYGIESQFPYLPDVEHNFIYLNDDFFFTGDLLPSDFYTSAYGVVIRLDPTLLIEPISPSSKDYPPGEWGPLMHSNWLICERFGLRPRPYPIHAAKSSSMPLLQEAAHIWEDEFRMTAEHKFRGMRDSETGAGDAYMSFLLTHLVVERWREALLWSWVVGRIGGDEDQWGVEQQMTAWKELGGDPEDVERKVDVRLTRRKTVEEDRVTRSLEASGQTSSKKTVYSFSSADGYPYSYADGRGKMSWPRFSGPDLGQDLCSINFHECIGAASSANEAFKLIAFQKPVFCGDCIIAALRSSSGVLGLSAFLPPRQRKSKPSSHSSVRDQLLYFDIWNGSDDADDTHDDDSGQAVPPVAHLPLVKTWAEGNFSLQAVLNPYGIVNVRAWTLRLLERYRFVLGDTGILFLMIEGPLYARKSLKAVTKDISLLCLNDDVRSRHEMTDKILRDWQRHRWSKQAEWER